MKNECHRTARMVAFSVDGISLKQMGAPRCLLWKLPVSSCSIMNKEDYNKIAPNFPTEPGVYRFIGPNDVILYIGKAKHLKKRVSSYFMNRKDMRIKSSVMVLKAVRIEYTIVDTEQDALLLEATLIQKHQPRYNVMLKSGKPYPYICIKNERFPRVFITRHVR